MSKQEQRIAYAKPEVKKVGNVRDVTFECPNWQCSVTVPPAP